jgi:hypothetical protein
MSTTTSDIMDAISPLGLHKIAHGGDIGKISSDARASAQAQTNPQIRQQRQQAEHRASQTLDQEAVAAIRETVAAVSAITADRRQDAVDAMERATGKINLVLARNPQTALIPVDVEVIVFDTAPNDDDGITFLRDLVDFAVDDMDYPAARSALKQLMSEIRVRTYHLPLATYPGALQEAARLLDQNRVQEAASALLIALGTLVAIEEIFPIPLLLAQEAVNQAEAKAAQDKSAALALLQTARDELYRAGELGYAGHAEDYGALRDEISKLEKQLKADENTSSVFTKLKEKLASFIGRQSKAKQDSQRAGQPSGQPQTREGSQPPQSSQASEQQRPAKRQPAA